MDEAAKLIHAILYRKGAKTYRRQIQKSDVSQSLSARVGEYSRKIDTPTELEGITF